MCADQPAQIDCRMADCLFYKGAGTCANVSPAITLNPDGRFVCWSKETSEPIHTWAQDDGARPIETLIDALRSTSPELPIWLTLGGAIDEFSTVGQFLARWWTDPHPMYSVARVVSISKSMLLRVPRMFTRPTAIQVTRGEQVYLLVIQDD